MSKQSVSITALVKRHKQIKLLYFSYSAIMLFTIVFAILYKGLFAAAIISACLLFYLLHLRPMVKRYYVDFNHLNLLEGTASLLENPEHSHKLGLDKDICTNSNLIPIGQNYLSRELLTGKWQDMSISAADVTTCYTYNVKNKKINEFISGCWLHAELKQPSQTNFCILSRSLMSQRSMDAFTITKDIIKLSDEMDQRFILFADDENNKPAGKLLTRFIQLCDYTTGSPAISVNGRNVDIFIKNRFLSAKASLRIKPDAGLMSQQIFPELGYILKILKAIN